MNKLFSLIISLLFISTSYAQVTTNTNLYELVDPDQQNVSLLYGENKTKYKGSPFFDEEWKPGFIILNDGNKFTNKLIRLDVANDDLWLMKNEDNIIIINKVDIKQFGWILEEESYQFEKCFLNHKPQFMEVIYVDDKFQLYKMYTKKFIKKDAAAENSYNSDIMDEYTWGKPQLYYKNDKNLTPISSKSKEFFLIFGEQKTAMQKFAKSNKLKIKDKKDLEEIFAHYYTLVH